MKKLIICIILIALMIPNAFAQVIFNIDPENGIGNENPVKNLEEKWKAAGVSGDQLYTSNNFVYNNDSGIGNTAAGIIPEINSLVEAGKTDIILTGFSMGGLVARKVLQDLPESSRQNVKGIVTLGTPQAGSRLADQGWAITCSVAAVPYAAVTAAFTLSAVVTTTVSFGGWFKNSDERIMKSMLQKMTGTTDIGQALKIIETLEKINTARGNAQFGSRPLLELGMDYGIPFVDAIMGPVFGNSTRGLGDLFGAAIAAPDGHSVREMGPTSSFLANLNSSKSVALEKNFKRVAIMNRNGDIFDTAQWYSIEVVLNMFRASRNAKLALAAKCWWNPLVWAPALVAAGTLALSIVMFENTNNFVSWMHTGKWGDHKNHEVLVPYHDEFFVSNLFTPGLEYGPKTYILDEHLRSADYGPYSSDKEITNDKVSHMDLPVTIPDLTKSSGKYGSKKGAALQLVDSFKQSYLFMTD